MAEVGEHGEHPRPGQTQAQWEEVNELRLDRDHIEAQTDQIRREIADIHELAQDRAWHAETYGVSLHMGGARYLESGGEDQYTTVAPSLHPVWSDELRDETRHLREMAEIDNRLRPWEEDYAKWPTIREWPTLAEGDDGTALLRAHQAREAQAEAYVRDHSDPDLALTKGEQRAYAIAHGRNTDSEERERGYSWQR